MSFTARLLSISPWVVLFLINAIFIGVSLILLFFVGRYASYQVRKSHNDVVSGIFNRAGGQVLLRQGTERKKKSFGKSTEDQQRAFKAAEMFAVRMGLTLEKQADGEIKTFEMLIREWYSLNEQRWQPGTKERYQCIIRDFLRPPHNLPMEQVDRNRVKRLLVDLLKIRSANTVEVVHAVISGIFSEAIDLGYTDKNPAYGLLKKIMPPKNKRSLSEPDPFNLQDRDRFLEVAWAKLPEPFPLILEPWP